jgi:hypothetical protein
MGYERAMYFKPDSEPVDLSKFGMSGGFAGLDKARYGTICKLRSFIILLDYEYFILSLKLYKYRQHLLLPYYLNIFVDLCFSDSEEEATQKPSYGKIKVARTETHYKVNRDFIKRRIFFIFLD